jgi:hypothetical protein
LIFTEECDTRKEARERERYYKNGCGKEKLKRKNAPIVQGIE